MESISILLLGDKCVGKTETLRSYTIGGSIHDAVNVLKEGRPVSVHTDECSSNLSCRQLSYPNRDMYVIIYDVNVRSSFESARMWFNEVSSFVPNAEFVLCGNEKTASHANAVVSPEEALAVAEDLGFRCRGSYRINAKTQDGLLRIFDDLIGFVLVKRDQDRLQHRQRVPRCCLIA